MKSEQALPVGYLLKQINMKCQNRMRKNLSSAKLTPAQLDLLNFLLDNKGSKITQKDIAEEFGIRHTTVIGLVKRLVAKGLVSCVVDPDNHKYRNITLTAAASQIEEKIHDHRREMNEIFTKGLSADEVEQLRCLLNKLRHNLE